MSAANPDDPEAEHFVDRALVVTMRKSHMASTERGKFIVLDGGEGCGKSTQSRLLSEALKSRGIASILVRDPGTTAIGEKIRAILLNPDNIEMNMRCEMLLYMAARAQMMAQVIAPALDRGQCVICDRFVSSTLAYQLGGDRLTSADIRQAAEVAIQGRWPDVTILLDMPPDQANQRIVRPRDRIEQRPPEYHQRVRANYLAQAREDPLRYRVIEANRELAVIEREIWQIVEPLVEGAAQ